MKKNILITIASASLCYVAILLFITNPQRHVISAMVPLVCAVILLLAAFKSAYLSVRWPLIVLATSTIAFGILVVLINSPFFADEFTRNGLNNLRDLKMVIGGIGIGAVLSSWASGQWKGVIHRKKAEA